MIREATRDDVLALYGEELAVPARLWVVERDGLKAIGGVVWIDGEAVATCRMLPDCPHKEFMRAVRLALSAIGSVVARRDRCIPGADRFLRRLGFVPREGLIYERADLSRA